ncbi:hypothetical protein, partial [Streptomyces europaeiscabiei]|uniref:hypothetical protein n=1 Tax=Streptomyces europaeiscabiei TaxID=146819 RepID=UPI0029A94193
MLIFDFSASATSIPPPLSKVIANVTPLVDSLTFARRAGRPSRCIGNTSMVLAEGSSDRQRSGGEVGRGESGTAVRTCGVSGHGGAHRRAALASADLTAASLSIR